MVIVARCTNNAKAVLAALTAKDHCTIQSLRSSDRRVDPARGHHLS